MGIASKSDNFSKRGLLFYLLGLTFIFILLEISFFIDGSGIYLGDFKLVARHLAIPSVVIPNILLFVGAQLLTHLLFVIVLWLIVCCYAEQKGLTNKAAGRVALYLWIFALITVFLANNYYFPNSHYATWINHTVPNWFTTTLFWLAVLSWVVLLAQLGVNYLLLKREQPKIFHALFLVLVSIGFYWGYTIVPQVSVVASEQPNVIIIGVDALRPDTLGFFGNSLQTIHFDRFLQHAVVFADSLTPLARTYPAWITILTGEYPKKTNVRFDLSSYRGFDLQNTLPAILKRHGYETIYASDETRFSNIDPTLGFDRIVTPPTGFNDFLLGTLNDFPLSNLIVNTRLGKYLFPYSYGNRPAFITYDPNTFLQMLAPVLQEPRSKPLFFAVHLCLTHYPYNWSSRVLGRSPWRNYQTAVKRADQQVYDLLELLAETHVLQHSIVILLSDHGEALELVGDRVTAAKHYIARQSKDQVQIPHFYPKSYNNEHVDQSAGHGTDVLSMTQYHNVLAFRLFGIDNPPTKIVTGYVSLLDIKPTVLSLLHLPTPYTDGRSLAPYIMGNTTHVALGRDFFMESDFAPASVRTVHPETRAVLFEGIDFFQIDPLTAHLSVKKDMGQLIISSKQYADVYDHWILALYPQPDHHMIPILVNLTTGDWTNDLQTPLAKHAPTRHMLTALKDFYGSDIHY